MKLNTRFSFIVIITVIQVIFLTVSMLYNADQMQKVKQYQYIQSETQSKLSSVIVFLDEIDHWGCKVPTVSRDWNERLESIDENFEYLIHDPITSTFTDECNETLSQMEKLWTLLKGRFEPITENFDKMSQIKLVMGISTYTEKYGIRYGYEKFPEDETLIQLMKLLEPVHSDLEGIRRSYLTLSKMNNKTAYEIADILEAQEKSFKVKAIIMAAISCLILSVLIFLLTTQVARRIVKIRDVTSVLAKKDFSVEVTPKGSNELKSLMENLNEMVSQINKFFILVKYNASKVIDSGQAINNTANSTAVVTSEIDENINKISRQFDLIQESVKDCMNTISEMDEHVETLVQNNSKQTMAISDSNQAVVQIVDYLENMNAMALERAESAKYVVKLVADGDEKISATGTSLEKIAAQLDEITEVITIINAVAEQTDLLSMNASIESAHAGEAGKGFAVVAGEIKKLAEETTENAARISTVISSIVGAVKNANSTSQEASKAFAKVTENVDSLVESFQVISSEIGKIDGQMQQIQTKSEETADVANQINTYCDGLAQIQQQVTNDVQEVSDKFQEALVSISEIKNETADIVLRMKDVANSSDESFKNMTELEGVLQQFRTKD